MTKTRLDTQSCDQANLGVGMTSRDIFINSIEKFYFKVPAAAMRGYPAIALKVTPKPQVSMYNYLPLYTVALRVYSSSLSNCNMINYCLCLIKLILINLSAMFMFN